jgi:type IV secretory pathway component VirB8
MFARLTKSMPDQLRRVRQTGATIKAEEEAASEARLAKMWAEEERLREELTQARAERSRRERLAVALAVGVGAIVVVIAIVAAILATGSASVPLSWGTVSPP